MKERGLLCQPDMALAAYEGIKLNTRRVIDPQPGESARNPFVGMDGIWRFECATTARGPMSHADDDRRCPYGVPGDRLWVREPWRTYESLNHLPPRSISRGAGIQYEAGGTNLPGDKGTYLLGMGKYRHARFMCRWMSRTLLEVTSVRVARLQDISEEDAIAEGVPFDGRWWLGGVHPVKGTPQCWPTAKRAFQALWDSINADRAPWASNPWVWAVGFKRVTQ